MKILQFLQEDNGNFSATRLAFLCYAFALTAKLVISAWRGTPFEPTDNTVWILVVLMSGKVVQKFTEPKSPPGGTP